MRTSITIHQGHYIPAYEVQLQDEADCNEAIWCNLVTGHTTVTIGVVYRCPNITKQNNEKIHNAISEVNKGDCIIMEDFNHGNGPFADSTITLGEELISAISEERRKHSRP